MGSGLGEAVYWITRLQLQLQSLINHVFQMMRPDQSVVSHVSSSGSWLSWFLLDLSSAPFATDLLSVLVFSDVTCSHFSSGLTCSQFSSGLVKEGKAILVTGHGGL
jgi:hypothetical protein